MKICFVGMEIVPTGDETFVGGLVNNVVRLAKELSKNGHELHIITSDTKNILKEAVSLPWAELLPVHLHGEYASSRSGLEFLLKVIPIILGKDSEQNFDVLHIHSAYPLLAPIGGLCSFIRKMPAIFSLYSPILTAPLGDRKGIYQGLSSLPLSELFFANIRTITVPSRNVKESLLQTGIKEHRIVRLPPVVDGTFIDGSSAGHDKRIELEIPEDAPVILYIGNWARWKGIDDLIETVADIRREFPDIRLVTAWAEPYNWYDERKLFITEKIKSLHLEENVIQVGIVRDIAGFIAMCDVFAAPFLNTDGVSDLPLAILESMACGKPVVATRVGGIPEIVRHDITGLLVEPGNRQELKEALSYILADRSVARNMGTNAKSFVKRNYRLDSVVERLETVYRDVTLN